MLLDNLHTNITACSYGFTMNVLEIEDVIDVEGQKCSEVINIFTLHATSLNIDW